MSITARLLDRLADTRLAADERARLRVRLSREHLDSGDYDAALEALDALWPQLGARPRLEGLGAAARAELLLHAGVLTGFVGSHRRVDGAQEQAKNLISEALNAFEEMGDRERVAEARAELAYCYWREGAFDEARVLLEEALRGLGQSETEARALALVRLAIVERSAGRFREALRAHQGSAAFFERLQSHSLKGRFHVGLAETYRHLAESEARGDYTDRAFIEYEAAAFHFSAAGHERYRAAVENNIACLLLFVGRHAQAHEHLDRARSIFDALGDGVRAAQTDETRARVLLAEGRLEEAERTARAAARALEHCDEAALFADALMTLGTVLARHGRREEARTLLSSAEEAALRAGAPEAAGRAALAAAEELGDEMLPREFGALFERAAERLAGSQQPGVRDRLNACALRFVKARAPVLDMPWRAARDGGAWDGFSLRREVLRYEAELIEKALRDAGGSVSRAAKLLGFRHHQTFVALLNNRHRELLHARNPIAPRKGKSSAHRRRRA
ncbi:MAG TPA: helix-turn-helix domain-containing protein [Pyrinomonadaceae bacterium]|nr:helix-turn-helix domain-containing protein [Pyrinomonadaceae bacterium]